MMNVQFSAQPYAPRFAGAAKSGGQPREEIRLTPEDLKTASQQFADLRKKIEAGEYKLEATKEGGRKKAYDAFWYDVENSTLKVTITPVEGKTDAKIRKISFVLKKNVRHYHGGSQDIGHLAQALWIETAGGKVYVFDESANTSALLSRQEQTELTRNPLLSELESLGDDKILEPQRAEEARLAAEKAIRDAEAARSAQERARIRQDNLRDDLEL